ncbi:MAG: hypothetical protein L7S72_01510 [Flavobacteriales bacterium]|nr:hypothetical protein [Flavobacteriales bacterium]
MIPQIVKKDKKVFTVYKHSKMLMNISGIKSIQELYIYQRRLKYQSFRIDNIMFSRKCQFNYDMNKLSQRAKMLYNHKYDVQYDEELQSAKGIYIIPKQKPGPSFVIYRTGSVTIMGAKHLHSKRYCEKMLKIIYDKSCLISK